MTTIVVCEKCKRVEEFHAAQSAGWLMAQRLDKPEGYLIIRCPEHVSSYARRKAAGSLVQNTGKMEKK